MKNYNIILAALLAGALTTACNDLDTQPTGNTVTSDQKQEVAAVDPTKAQAAVTGIAGMLDAAGSIVGNDGLQSDQWDFGHPSLFLQMDMRGIDMYSILSGYNWYIFSEEMSDCLVTSDNPNIAWQYNYKVIRACNSLLATVLPGIDPEASDDATNMNKFYAAQGLAFRAYSYLWLAQTFQFTYDGNQTALCVPILTDENEQEVAANGCARNTVQEVYDQILADLTKAISFLQGNPVTPSTIVSNKANRFASLAVCYGLRARANLLMTKWADAAADAQAAINFFGQAPLSLAEAAEPGFQTADDHNWMWGIIVAETDLCVTTGIINFPSHMGSFNYGYATAVGAWKWVSTSLFKSIPRADVRRGWFLDESGMSANLTADQQAFVTSAGAGPLVQVKFAPYKDVVNQQTNASDIPLMRVEEMYYILAEAQAMTSPETGKTTLVNFVTTYRNPSYVCNATTSAELRDEIWHQRRLEFWGEGLSYFDLMRLKKGVDRRGAGFPAQVTYNVAPDDPVLVYPIPNSEVTANKLLTEATNNPGGAMPTPVQ